jgi:hypothetical protein
MNIVSKDGEIPEGHQSTRHAAIDRRDALIGHQLKPGRIEDLLSGDIQLRESFN